MKRCSAGVLIRSLAAVLAGMLLAGITQRPAQAGPNDLIRVKRADGSRSSLHAKVVVISAKAQLKKSLAGEGDFIEPFAVFFRLKTPDGQLEQNGFYRVGDSLGNPLGWIKKEHLKSWNTRFVLAPLPPRSDRTFVVQADGGGEAKLKTVAEGKRRYAFISGPAKKTNEGKENPNGPFPVIVCCQAVRSSAGGADLTEELNNLKDLKLEIVFVFESTDFMTAKFENMTVLQSFQDLMGEMSRQAKADPILSKKMSIRFGLVEYQDSNKDADYVSRVPCPLTANLDEFMAAVRGLKPKLIKGDHAEDAISGLNSALAKSGWEQNSCKHVILIGAGSMQLYPDGSGPNQFGSSNNQVTKNYNRTRGNPNIGANNAGLSLERLIAKASPEGGSIEVQARNRKMFHSVLGMKNLGRLDADTRKLVDDVVQSSDAQLEALIKGGVKAETLLTMFGYFMAVRNRDLARQQYRQLSQNRGTEGLFLEMEPNRKSIEATATELQNGLKESLVFMNRLLQGDLDVESFGGTQAIAQSFYVLVGAAADKFKDSPTLVGTAGIRDKRGRQVASKKVMVSKTELIRLKSSLDALYSTFKSRTSKVDRSDVTKILGDLQESIAKTGAGQTKLAPDTNIKDLISDLPLRTTALDTTAGQIAVMSSDAFKQWLNRIQAAIYRAEDLLGGKADWMYLTKKAENDQFTFLHLSELP